MEKILYKYWEQEEPNTIINQSFVDNVILPAMKEYAEQSTHLYYNEFKSMEDLEKFIDSYDIKEKNIVESRLIRKGLIVMWHKA
jgi:hypothetical protein